MESSLHGVILVCFIESPRSWIVILRRLAFHLTVPHWYDSDNKYCFKIYWVSWYAYLTLALGDGKRSAWRKPRETRWKTTTKSNPRPEVDARFKNNALANCAKWSSIALHKRRANTNQSGLIIIKQTSLLSPWFWVMDLSTECGYVNVWIGNICSTIR